ncbi:hypothetical protein HYU91_00710 [Candidatus Collierbacteria bacterium]|nr:hypothetical protein [Candidatus Collierbacteria bacterium]
MPQSSSTQSARATTDLGFISDVTLRRKLVEAIETTSALYLVQQDPNYSGIAKEIRRIIVLYCASIIEAVFLYLYKRNGFKLTKLEYRDVQTLTQRYQLDSNCKFVIASQVDIPRHERELMLDLLLKLFVDENIISKQLGDKIEKAKSIRNTLHLAKSRSGLIIGQSGVKTAIDAVYETIIVVRNHLTNRIT